MSNCRERVKFTQLREVFTQLQKSNQHLERELEKRKEREAELLTFSANLSSSNAELTAERSDWEAKVCNMHWGHRPAHTFAAAIASVCPVGR